MTTSVNEVSNAVSSNRDGKILQEVLESLRADLAAVAAKLDADGAITATTYVSGLTTTK